MGARHHSVDARRTTFPISGTALRAELGAHFAWLVPAARAELARRIVLVGAESTGKTTMAEELAAELGSVWVPEHGRWYWEGRRYRADAVTGRPTSSGASRRRSAGSRTISLGSPRMVS